MPEDSKQYLRGLALHGGTANVLADKFGRWFDGLWHGKSLAFNVGCIAILISSGIFYAATARHRAKNPMSAVKITAAKAAGTPVEAFLSDARQRGLLPNRRRLWDHRRTPRREKNAVMERL